MPRMLFKKTGNAVYISHLDLMRVFQRAFKRAGLLLRHSQGFSPRAHVSIALPLSVGVESVCELLDFDLAEGVSVPLAQIPAMLNRTMPTGIQVLEIWERGRKLRDLTHLDVALRLEYDAGIPEDAASKIKAFFQGESPIIVTKQTKNGPVDVDIQPMITNTEVRIAGPQELHLTCRICAQNPSLNPALLIRALETHLPESVPDFTRICRLEILDAQGTPFR